jgi:purine-binding chemotaxis protein CheW
MNDLLLFRIARELFAADLRAVEEAIDLSDVQQVPGAAHAVRGVFTLRGMLVPLFSPVAVLGVAPIEAATALVLRDAGGRVGIGVDDVEDVLAVRPDDVRPLPGREDRDGGVVRGVVRSGPHLVAVVDLEALVAACRGRHHPEAA